MSKIDILNKHLTKKGATSVDGNDRVTKAYRYHTPGGPAKDIWAQVSEVGNREVGVGAIGGGYSGEVSRGVRPKHVAGKRSYKRV
jgi:hypothetical protein